MTVLYDIYKILKDQDGVPISAGLIGKVLKIKQDNTHYAVRKLIRKLIEKGKVPICACPQGYYIIKSDRELEEYKTRLRSRISNIAERMYYLTKAHRSFNGGQNEQSNTPHK